MPFCEQCSRYWAPSAMTAAGACPTCGRNLGGPTAGSGQGISSRIPANSGKIDIKRLAAGESEEPVSAPWHFKLLVVGLALYLGWRIVDLFL
jgi:hypothetical protein